jgi:Helix-turn-helix domain
MKHPSKVKAPPKKGEARINHHSDSGPSSKQSQQRDSSRPPGNGKVTDSRTKVIEQAMRTKIGIPFHTTAPGLAQELMAIRDANAGSSASVQEARLEQALRRSALTTFEMQKWLDLYDPRARIQGLRLAGHEIHRTWVAIETDCGQRHRVGRFTMQRGTKAPAPEQSDLLSSPAVPAVDAERVPV